MVVCNRPRAFQASNPYDSPDVVTRTYPLYVLLFNKLRPTIKTTAKQQAATATHIDISTPCDSAVDKATDLKVEPWARHRQTNITWHQQMHI